MAKKAVWQNRIVGHADVDPQTLTANPLNFRRHPKAQADATSVAAGDQPDKGGATPPPPLHTPERLP
jgi:hypothetical protein